MTEESVKNLIFAGIRSPHRGHSARVEERSALVRVAVLCRLLAEELDDLETEVPTAQLVEQLTVLRERTESELRRAAELRQ